MKKSIFLIIFFSALLSSFAQTTQLGIVKEYNEKSPKSPLAGVEIRVRPAINTVSEKDGTFSLQFLTLKPGEKVNVRNIDKLGYEIFNKEAIDQWNINPTTPFVIVMCRSDKFKAIRDNYQRMASANYDKQFKMEQANLSKLKAEGKLKEAEYQKSLAELTENYDKQLENLDNYVDKFSRIDLSELSLIEQGIIDLVKQGKFEEAIRKYDNQNYLDQYRQEMSEMKETTIAIDTLTNIKKAKEQACDSLLAAIYRQIETLKLAGGKENFSKIGFLLREIANIDTLNYKIQFKTGVFLSEQNDQDAMIFLERCEKSDSAFLKAQAFLYLSGEFFKLKDYEKAFSLAENSFDIVRELNFPELEIFVLSQISMFSNYSKKNYSNINDKLLSFINKKNDNDYLNNTLKAFVNMTIATNMLVDKCFPIEDQLNYIEQGIHYAELAFQQAEDQDSRKNIETSLLCHLKTMKFDLFLQNNKEIWGNELRKLYENVKSNFFYNPRKYESSYKTVSLIFLKYLVSVDDSSLIKSFNEIYLERGKGGSDNVSRLKDFDELIVYANTINKQLLSIDLFNEFARISETGSLDKEESNLYGTILLRISLTYSEIRDETNQITLLRQSVDTFSKLEETEELDTNSQSIWFPLALSELGNYYLSCEEYEKALSLYTKSINYFESRICEDNLIFLLQVYWNSSICHLNLKDMVMSNKFLDKMISIEKKVSENKNSHELLSHAYCNLSWNEYEEGNYDRALDLVNKGIKYNTNFIPLLENKGAILLKMGEVEEAKTILQLIESISNSEIMKNTDLYKELNAIE